MTASNKTTDKDNVSPEALAFYNEALALERTARNRKDWEAVIKKYRESLEVDSGFTLAHVALSLTLMRVHGVWVNDEKYIDEAIDEAKAAIALDPDLPDAHFALAKSMVKTKHIIEAINLLEQLKEDHPEYRQVYKFLGELYLRIGKTTSAHEMFKRDRELSKQVGNKLAEAASLNSIGTCWLQRSDFLQAAAKFIQVIELADELEDMPGKAMALNNLAVVYKAMSRWDEASKAFDLAFALFQELGDQRGEIAVLNGVSEMYQIRGDYEASLNTRLEILQLARDIGDRMLEALILNNIGLDYGRLGKILESIEHLEDSLEKYRQLKLKQRECECMMDLGSAYCDLGDLDRAFDCYQKALPVTVDVENQYLEVIILGNMGEILEFRGDIDEALEKYRIATDLMHTWEPGARFHEIDFYKGRVSYNREQYRKAKRLFANLLEHRGLKAVMQLRVSFFLNLCYMAENEITEKSREEADEILEEMERIKCVPELLEAYRNLGSLLILRDREILAREYLEKGRKLAEQSGMKREQAIIEEFLMQTANAGRE